MANLSQNLGFNRKMAGRKSLKDEIRVVQYMAELAPKTFAFIQACLEGEDKADRKWASEQMNKLFAKAIPQTIDGDSDNPLQIQITGMKIIKDGDTVPNPQPETTPGG